MPTDWDLHHFEERVTAILRDTPAHVPGHHFGRPYLTPYQIAIAFDHLYPEVARAMKLKIGGKGLGEPNSLTQYIAGQLSYRIKLGDLRHIEGALLSDSNLKSLSFSSRGHLIESSLVGAYDLTLFRYRDE